MRDQRIDQLPTLVTERPDADGLVEPAGRYHFPRRMNRDRIEPVERFAERVEALSSGRVPNLHGAVGGGGEQTLAVGGERQIVDSVDVIFECADLFSRGKVPELDELVVAVR